MSLAIVVAMTNNRVIGRRGKLPWHIPEDLRQFKHLTMDNAVVMGRKTYESILERINGPLPGRYNIVVSTTMQPQSGLYVCRSIPEAIEQGEKLSPQVFIIGGARIFEQTIPLVDSIYVSVVKKDYEGDAFFPAFREEDWVVEKEEDHDEYVYRLLRRKNPVQRGA